MITPGGNLGQGDARPPSPAPGRELTAHPIGPGQGPIRQRTLYGGSWAAHLTLAEARSLAAQLQAAGEQAS